MVDLLADEEEDEDEGDIEDEHQPVQPATVKSNSPSRRPHLRVHPLDGSTSLTRRGHTVKTNAAGKTGKVVKEARGGRDSKKGTKGDSKSRIASRKRGYLRPTALSKSRTSSVKQERSSQAGKPVSTGKAGGRKSRAKDAAGSSNKFKKTKVSRKGINDRKRSQGNRGTDAAPAVDKPSGGSNGASTTNKKASVKQNSKKKSTGRGASHRQARSRGSMKSVPDYERPAQGVAGHPARAAGRSVKAVATGSKSSAVTGSSKPKPISPQSQLITATVSSSLKQKTHKAQVQREKLTLLSARPSSNPSFARGRPVNHGQTSGTVLRKRAPREEEYRRPSVPSRVSATSTTVTMPTVQSEPSSSNSLFPSSPRPTFFFSRRVTIYSSTHPLSTSKHRRKGVH